jgi:hypothetical protein
LRTGKNRFVLAGASLAPPSESRIEKILPAGASSLSGRRPAPPLSSSDARSPFGTDVVLSRLSGFTEDGGGGSFAQLASKLVNLRIHKFELLLIADQRGAEGCWIR